MARWRFLCSDHAPHCDYEKEVEFDYAPFGITGLETELALSLMQLYHSKRLGLADLIAKFTVAPARLLHLPKGTLSVGADADVTVFDPDREWVFERGRQREQRRRTAPFTAGRSAARRWPRSWAAGRRGLNKANWRRSDCSWRLRMKAILALEDGSVFHGAGFGARASACGEVCFNTSMTGYQEILTDPSYKGQIVTMTYPLIGNYGVNRQDVESWRPHVAGFVIRELSPVVSNWRAESSLAEYSGAERHSRHPGN